MKLQDLPGVTVSEDGRMVEVLADVTIEQAEAAMLDGGKATSHAGILKALGDRFECFLRTGYTFETEKFDLGVAGTYWFNRGDREAMRGETVRAIDRPEHIPAFAGESKADPIKGNGGDELPPAGAPLGMRAPLAPAVPKTSKPKRAVKQMSSEEMASGREIRKRIKSAAREAGVSLGDLAGWISVHATFFTPSCFQRISMEKIHKVAEILNVTPHWLYTGSNDPGVGNTPEIMKEPPTEEEARPSVAVRRVNARLAAIQRLADAAVALIGAEVDFAEALQKVNQLAREHNQ